jgi:ketosteroid isomerase-like protein
MSELPELLLDRLGVDGPLIASVIDEMAEAISDQYMRDAVAFDAAEGDNAWTFAVNLHAHSWARIIERVDENAVVNLIQDGLAHAVQAGPLTIRPYKLGPDAPEDIRLVRLEPSSATKALIAESNDAVVHGQLALDLAAGLPAPSDTDLAARYAPDLLVMAHFGNPRQGRQAIYLGAPRPLLRDGSYWEWVIQLAGSGPDVGGAMPVPDTGEATPAFSERDEPAVPLSSRGGDRKKRNADVKL